MNAATRRAVNVLFIMAVLYAAWLMLELTLPYLALRRGVAFLKTKEHVYHIRPWRLSFYVHVFSAMAVLVCGLFQFSGYLIRSKKRLHRTLGYIYTADVLLITGPAALIMSFYANWGGPARVSFTLQSLAWLFCTAMALNAVLKKRFVSHGEWMLRSYALTLAALTLRLYKAVHVVAGWHIHPVTLYIIISWLSWVPNLIIAELMINAGFVSDILRRR